MDISLNNARTELALTLARGLLPPSQRDTAALLALLADDLQDLGTALGLDLAVQLTAFRDACATLGDAALLVHYSRLFLVPPVAARLNLGWYLDGSLNGPLQDSLAGWHASRGMTRANGFRDLTDHLAAMLEFLGLLESRGESADAGTFATQLILPALAGLEGDVARAAADSPYRSLIAWLRAALTQLYGRENADARTSRTPFAKRASRPGWVHCDRCHAPIATARDLAFMRKALTDNGLPSDHLALCPDCRGAARGRVDHPMQGSA